MRPVVALLDNTSMSSIGRGEVAVGSESLFITDWPKDSSDRLWMGCMIMFDTIRSNETKHTRTIMVSGYLRLRQGLVPGQPLLVALSGCCGVVRKEGPSLLGPFGLPRWGGLPFLVSPGWGGGENFPLPPPRFRGRIAPRCFRTMSPI